MIPRKVGYCKVQNPIPLEAPPGNLSPAIWGAKRTQAKMKQRLSIGCPFLSCRIPGRLASWALGFSALFALTPDAFGQGVKSVRAQKLVQNPATQNARKDKKTGQKTKKATKPAAKPVSKPVAKPKDKQTAKPSAKPSTKKIIDEVMALLDKGIEASYLKRLKLIPKILQIDPDTIATRFLPLLEGDRNRLSLKVQRLIEGLGDPRFKKREAAQRALLQMGPRIFPILGEQKTPDDLEVKIRLHYVLKALKNMGNEDIVRLALRARLIAEALAYAPNSRNLVALAKGLSHLDHRVRKAALDSIISQLRTIQPEERTAGMIRTHCLSLLEGEQLGLRNAALTTLSLLPQGRDRVLSVLQDPRSPTSLKVLALNLLSKANEETRTQLPKFLKKESSSWLGEVAQAMATSSTPTTSPPIELKARVRTKEDQEIALDSTIESMFGNMVLISPPKELASLGTLIFPRDIIDKIDFEGSTKKEAKNPEPSPIKNPEKKKNHQNPLFLVLKSGMKLSIQNPSFKEGVLLAKTLGRVLKIPQSEIRGFLSNTKRKFLFGGSRMGDQLRLKTTPRTPKIGKIVEMNALGVTFEKKGKKIQTPWNDIGTLQFKVGNNLGLQTKKGNLGQFIQVDLNDGQRLIAFLADLDRSQMILTHPLFGSLSLKLSRVKQLVLSNSGQALAGFTLIVDYGEYSVKELDADGKVVWSMEDLYSPMDAEILPNGNILITEQEENAVREYTRKGDIVWEFTECESPREADGLPNGNVLITDMKNRRVIEVNRKKKITWSFGVKEGGSAFKPYDADRLSNGNTLIADFGGSRIIEVSPSGKIVWQQRNIPFLWDVDPLPNGNILATLHKAGTKASTGKILEIRPDHKITWEIRVKNPSDADLLPDGTILVAEGNAVSLYNRAGKLLKKWKTDWSARASRY
jgi:hypothetical protein